MPSNYSARTKPVEDANWRCENCGHEQLFTITEATIEVGLVVFCSGCGFEMTRKDALGELESEMGGRKRHFNAYLSEMNAGTEDE